MSDLSEDGSFESSSSRSTLPRDSSTSSVSSYSSFSSSSSSCSEFSSSSLDTPDCVELPTPETVLKRTPYVIVRKFKLEKESPALEAIFKDWARSKRCYVRLKTIVVDDLIRIQIDPKFKGRNKYFKLKKRSNRCGRCYGCSLPNCLQCSPCKDMKKYGGPGTKKQACKKRFCFEQKNLMLSFSSGDESSPES